MTDEVICSMCSRKLAPEEERVEYAWHTVCIECFVRKQEPTLNDMLKKWGYKF